MRWRWGMTPWKGHSPSGSNMEWKWGTPPPVKGQTPVKTLPTPFLLNAGGNKTQCNYYLPGHTQDSIFNARSFLFGIIFHGCQVPSERRLTCLIPPLVRFHMPLLWTFGSVIQSKGPAGISLLCSDCMA